MAELWHSRRLVQIFDVVLEDEQIRQTRTRNPNETLVVILDDAFHLLAIAQLDADRYLLIDEALQILHLFKCLLGRAGAFSFGFGHVSLGKSSVSQVVPAAAACAARLDRYRRA